MTVLCLNKRGIVCLFLFVAVLLFVASAEAQKRRPSAGRTPAKRMAPVPAVVIDERLAVLRVEPSLSSIPLQRMRAGRTMLILGDREADGVKFYHVSLPPQKSGWVQSEAVVSTVRHGDDARLVELIRASRGFDQIERAVMFLETFNKSPFRPAVLLLLGDLIEEQAQRLSRDATRRFDTEEIKASGAPLHSFYMNFNGLDRYRRLGIQYVFNRNQKRFHYEGTYWREILQKHQSSPESAEAKKRLDALAEKMKQ
ncbi:MAG TPA: hypothetical protein VEX64_04200 [Pyrinomonadaceae bacterium]|nr:hypothetical protein [Pyrinomonadaceae bacterium]